MLKLEKTQADLLLTMRKKEGLFTPYFYFAFGIALFFHLLPWIFFQIAPLSPYQSAPVFPYLPVFVDIDQLNTRAFAQIEEQLIEDLVQLVTPPAPTLSKDPFLTQSYTSPFLLELEKAYKDLFFMEFLTPPQVNQPFFSVTLPLSFYSSRGLPSPFFSSLLFPYVKTGMSNNYLVAFNVEVDGERGKVAWFEKTTSCGLKEVDKIAEQSLKELQFPYPLKAPFVFGQIEVTVRL